ncbi:coat protein [ssRNA phage SRR6049586_1]|uniref:Coat protein n=1 Tax=ssRNA phage SRR6049586_1 TaxID=2786480 RepID=A0A8S5L032_9VIRU|nr:coat protein [ssRNA phage SRR6049586_1]DAD50928.1 TPA_asm: coat protein [ssRNA phage SRR6049586_1]
MPAIANITVKKNDDTTDIVWTAVQPSSGDGTPAT